MTLFLELSLTAMAYQNFMASAPKESNGQNGQMVLVLKAKTAVYQLA
jgi:hypothetical protein